MAISFSRPDPSSPAAVAAATFTMSRRGFDSNEVRELLRMVAAELARLQEREKFLEREVRTAQRGAPNASIALDEEVVTRMLGEEAARILHTAREAATQIKVRAEEGASRLLREATDEAQRVRQEAEVESARRRQDASSDAEAELQMAKQQGRDMVNEARAYRERVLGELARRRELARQQIEQLVHGRDRLLQSFERARLVAVDVMAEMTPLGEPSEYVNLAPTTGPVPLMVPAARVQPTVEPEPEPDDLLDDVAVDSVAVDDVAVDSVAVDEAPAEELDEDATDDDAEVAEADEADEAEALDDPDDDRPTAPVVALFAGEFDRAQAAAEPTPDDEPSVDDLFARLRAARNDSVAERSKHPSESPDESDESADEPVARDLVLVDDLSVFEASPTAPEVVEELDDSPFGRRDAALTPVIVASARRLKRVLADEQNDVLSTLRRSEPVHTLDIMLPWQAEQADRYIDAIRAELEAAALAGAASVDAGKAAVHKKDIARTQALRPATDLLTTSVVVPLRDRLERAVADAEGDNEQLASAVRSIFREWKSQRIDEHLDDVVQMAFGRGALAALNPGTPVCWTVDPNGPACPDAEDNALAGVIGAGESFPTDHVCAPAHEGCRCMLALAPR